MLKRGKQLLTKKEILKLWTGMGKTIQIIRKCASNVSLMLATMTTTKAIAFQVQLVNLAEMGHDTYDLLHVRA